MKNTFSKATAETKAQTAIQMVIMDAIERGATDKDGLIAYMQSEVFANAVKRYMELMETV